MLLLTAVIAVSTGCQTFSLTEEQFAKQQHGECVDPETGRAVATGGTAAYNGAMLGALIASLIH